MRKSVESQETVLRQPLYDHKEVYYCTSVAIPYRHVCSCLFARCPHTDLRVAQDHDLPFSQKAMETRPGDLVGAGPNWVTFWSKFRLF